jgi:diguanylate cyclase (GGDEF)-like protein
VTASRPEPGAAAHRDLAARLRGLPRTLRPRLQRVEALRDLVRAANETVDPRRVAEVIVTQASGWLPLAAWAVLVDDWVEQPRLLAARGLAPGLVPLAQRIAALTCRTGRDWATASAAVEFAGAPAQAALALALPCRGRTRAALVGLDATSCSVTPRLTPQGRDLLALGLEPLCYALDSALSIRRAEELSVTDDLTQLYNSRFLAQVLRREAKRSSRTRRPLSLLFLDLDGFKDVNDTHGHLSGSRVLAELAAVLRGCGRETDVVARFGGDEFAVVLPDTDAMGARAVAERIRDRVAAHTFLEREALRVRLTVSVGIATLPGGGATAETLLQQADRAMYAVKERGKNGIEAAPASAG